MPPKGRIVSLELENFKSFRGKVHLGPFADFTCIIGPNGSGKSNTMDGICFVLGVRATQMRESSLKDLIWTDGKVKESKASVTMVLDVGKPLTLRRTVKGDGGSEYRVNDKVTTYEEYDRVLKELHILTKARNFLVFQGDVQNIAAQSPKKLTTLLETVSRADEYRKEFEEKLVAKEAATQKLLEASSRRRGVRAEKHQFKVQKKEAEQFETLTTEYAATKSEHAVFQLYHLDQALKAEEKAGEAQEEKVAELVNANKGDTKRLNAANKEVAQLTKKSLDMVREFRELSSAVAKSTEEEDKLKMGIRHTEEKLEVVNTNLKRIQTTGQKQTTEVEDLQRQLAELKTKKTYFERQMREEAAEEEGEMTASQLTEYQRLKTKAQTETINIAQELNQQLRQQATHDAALKQLDSRRQQMEARARQIQDSDAAFLERRTQLNQQKERATRDLQVAEVELRSLKEAMGGREAKHAEIEERLRTVGQQLGDMQTGKQESVKEKTMKEALRQLMSMFSGVRGTFVGGLAKVPDAKYRTAVTVAMGKNLDAVIVDTERVAMDCIGYLKENRIPPMTFIPLASIRTKNIDERLRNLGGTCRPIFDCLSFDPSLEPAVQYAVGDTLVCDKMPEAKRIAFGGRDQERHKVVTADGSVILKNGCIQGGQQSMEERARKWDEKDYDAKKQERDELLEQLRQMGDLGTVKQREHELESSIITIRSTLQYHVQDLTTNDRKWEGSSRELDNLKKVIADMEPQIREARTAVDRIGRQVKKLEGDKRNVEQATFGDFGRRVKISNIEEYEVRRNRKQEERVRKEAEFNVTIRKLESQIEFARKRNDALNPEALQKTVKVYTDGLKKDRVKLEVAAKARIDLGGQLDTLKSGIDEVKVAVAAANSTVKDIKREMGSVLDDIVNAKKLLANKQGACDKVKSARTALLQKCELEQVEISDPLPKALRALAVDRAAYSKKCAEYDDTLQRIEADAERLRPNMKAMERLTGVSSKFEDSNRTYEECDNLHRKTVADFKAIHNKRRKKFVEAYDTINENLDAVYKELTKDSRYPVGGTAFITTDNFPEPWAGATKYNVMPVTKRFMEMEHLSGGEKTVAALALLFTLHRVEPSPFFILDEIDDALDATNVQKVCRFLRESCGDCQFLVISLKETFYRHADSLVGIYKDVNAKGSGCLTWDLTQHDEDDVSDEGEEAAAAPEPLAGDDVPPVADGEGEGIELSPM